jgi:hypothetical protein
MLLALRLYFASAFSSLHRDVVCASEVGLTRYPKARERPGGRSRPAVLYFAASAAAPRS